MTAQSRWCKSHNVKHDPDVARLIFYRDVRGVLRWTSRSRQIFFPSLLLCFLSIFSEVYQFCSQITNMLCHLRPRDVCSDCSVQSNLPLSSIIVWCFSPTSTCRLQPSIFFFNFYFLCCFAATELFITPVVICYIVLLPWKHVTFEMDMGRQQFGAQLCVSNWKREREADISLAYPSAVVFRKFIGILEYQRGFWCESRG